MKHLFFINYLEISLELIVSLTAKCVSNILQSFPPIKNKFAISTISSLPSHNFQTDNRCGMTFSQSFQRK